MERPGITEVIPGRRSPLLVFFFSSAANFDLPCILHDGGLFDRVHRIDVESTYRFFMFLHSLKCVDASVVASAACTIRSLAHHGAKSRKIPASVLYKNGL